ncbi:MAG: hypothetical protein H6880_04570 [Rhodobiaceae bacterium]|nr:hypothetical protein [Rhodobiaceae bacterium]
MTMPRTVLGLLLVCAMLSIALPARAEMCRIADPTDTSLNVRDTPGGKVINKLRNGRKVFIDTVSWDAFNDDGSFKWVHVTGEYKGQWRDWGWVFRRHLDCGDHREGDAFPIIFESAKEMIPTGIVVPWSLSPEPKLEHECFYYGDGGYGMSLSDDLVKAYTARGYTLEQLCIVLRTADLKYDPETGERLPTFVVVDPKALAQAKQSGFFEGFEATPEMPLHAPDCFAHSNAQMPGSGYATLDIACDIRFDPWTGVELSPLEQAYYKKNVVLRIEGDAGPSGVIGGKELIVSGQNRATNASIRMVTTFRNKGN